MLGTNAYFQQVSGSVAVHSRIRAYNYSCSCGFSSSCNISLGMYDSGSSAELWLVPGFVRGCFVMEALRQSHLECFYDDSCLQQLRSYFTSTNLSELPLLDSSIPSHFSINTSFGAILDEMMVESWNWSVHHEQYFEVCQPEECIYSILMRHDIVGVFTIMISLVGGLITALKLTVPRVVKIIMRYLHRRRNVTIQPVLSMKDKQIIPAAPPLIEDM